MKVNHVFNSLKDESLEQTLIVIGILLKALVLLTIPIMARKQKVFIARISWRTKSTKVYFQTTGSDTIVTHNGKIYEKPADVEDAVRLEKFLFFRLIRIILQNHLNFEWIDAHCLQRS